MLGVFCGWGAVMAPDDIQHRIHMFLLHATLEECPIGNLTEREVKQLHMDYLDADLDPPRFDPSTNHCPFCKTSAYRRHVCCDVAQKEAIKEVEEYDAMKRHVEAAAHPAPPEPAPACSVCGRPGPGCCTVYAPPAVASGVLQPQVSETTRNTRDAYQPSTSQAATKAASSASGVSPGKPGGPETTGTIEDEPAVASGEKSLGRIAFEAAYDAEEWAAETSRHHAAWERGAAAVRAAVLAERARDLTGFELEAAVGTFLDMADHTQVTVAQARTMRRVVEMVDQWRGLRPGGAT